MNVSTQAGCLFAVRSGGHMNWNGSSNIGSSGFTIDLEKLNEVTLSDDQSTVAIGPGSPWVRFRPDTLTKFKQTLLPHLE